jgi:hypothetical protein
MIAQQYHRCTQSDGKLHRDKHACFSVLWIVIEKEPIMQKQYQISLKFPPIAFNSGFFYRRLTGILFWNSVFIYRNSVYLQEFS